MLMGLASPSTLGKKWVRVGTRGEKLGERFCNKIHMGTQKRDWGEGTKGTVDVAST